MKLCPFCDPTQHTTHHLLHGDKIHLHVHCSNVHLTHIRDQSNTDISTALYHLGILFTHSPYPHHLGCDPFRTFLDHLLHQYDDNINLSSDIPDQTVEPQPFHHSTVAQRTHRNITTYPIAWHHLHPTMTPACSDYLAYSHGLVSSLPPVNYSRASMNFIDHTYIGVLPRSAHTTIRRSFSTFGQRQQRAHNNTFPRPATTSNIMNVYWDAAKTQPDLLRTLNCLNPPNNMKFYRLISKAWNKVLITLLQRARNIQTIIDALVFNHSRTESTRPDAHRVPATIPPPCGRNLVQTILRRKVIRAPLAAPTRQTPCDHARCNLYAAAHMNRSIIKGGSLF